MAPVLLCPDCGTKHPLDDVADVSAFPCSGCGRTLKVPEQARESSAARRRRRRRRGRRRPRPQSAPPVAPAPVAPLAVIRTRRRCSRRRVVPWRAAAAAASPPPLGPPPGLPRSTARAAPVAVEPRRDRGLVPPVWIRFLLWIVAVPLAFLVVFGLAQGASACSRPTRSPTSRSAEGWGRFWPIARLLPFVALATAVLVQGGVVRHRARSATATPAQGPAPARRAEAVGRSRRRATRA